jgi:hypothetical protein
MNIVKDLKELLWEWGPDVQWKQKHKTQIPRTAPMLGPYVV